MRGRPKARLVLSGPEREALRALSRSASTSQAIASRARIVLACAEGATNSEVAARLGVSAQTAGKWRERFIRYRMDGLRDQPRPGPPRRIGEKEIADVVARTLREPPAGNADWSTRSMAAVTGLSQTTVGRIWRAFGLQPERVAAWRLMSTDPKFMARVRDVAGLYLDPPNRMFGLYLGEPHSAAPGPPVTPAGTPGLAALEIAADLAAHSRPGRYRQLVAFLRSVESNIAAAWEVHLLCDQPIGAGPGATALRRWLSAHPRVHLHIGPIGPPWSDLVRRWLVELSRRGLPGWTPSRLAALDADLARWLAGWPDTSQPFAWIRSGHWQLPDELTTHPPGARP